MHAHGKIVCVWIDTTVTEECTEVYCKMHDLNIDSYCTDFPLHVHTVWKNYAELLKVFSGQKDELLKRLKMTGYKSLEVENDNALEELERLENTLSQSSDSKSTDNVSVHSDEFKPIAKPINVLKCSVETVETAVSECH